MSMGFDKVFTRFRVIYNMFINCTVSEHCAIFRGLLLVLCCAWPGVLVPGVPLVLCVLWFGSVRGVCCVVPWPGPRYRRGWGMGDFSGGWVMRPSREKIKKDQFPPTHLTITRFRVIIAPTQTGGDEN
jgi:hypothetical protein